MLPQAFSKIWVVIILIILIEGGFSIYYFLLVSKEEGPFPISEKIIFYSREKILESCKRESQEICYQYNIYSVNLDGSSLKKIFSYVPQTTSLSIIKKFGDDKIRIFRVNTDTDARIIDAEGNMIDERQYAPSEITLLIPYISPDKSKVLLSSYEHKFEVYDLQSKRTQTFSVDFDIPGDIGTTGFVDKDYITIGWGDMYMHIIGLVEYNFETGEAMVKDERRFSALGGDLFYLDKKIIMGYENYFNEESFEVIPPSTLYTINLDTGERNDIFQSETMIFEDYSIPLNRKFVAFSTNTSTILIVEIENSQVMGIREINIPETLIPEIPIGRETLHWTNNNQKLGYLAKDTNDLVVVDITSKEVDILDKVDVDIKEIVGILKIPENK